MLGAIDDRYVTTREVVRAVATHVMARARASATGRFGLRVTPGGFGTPEFGAGAERVRVSGQWLVRETAGPAGARSGAIELSGSSLTELATFAGVDLTTDFSVGHDTPPLGDVHAPIEVDPSSLTALSDWYALVAVALDRTVAAAPDAAAPTVAQLWPEHFDVALDLSSAAGRRVNLGGSPGDEWHPDPYLYVGPWTPDRPGDGEFWNAPFGAVLGHRELVAVADPVEVGVAFFQRGLQLLAT